jgi:hypothetical protein
VARAERSHVPECGELSLAIKRHSPWPSAAVPTAPRDRCIHFAHRIDCWDDDGENFAVAKVAYRAACKRWPQAAITLRQGARVIEDSRQRRLA